VFLLDFDSSDIELYIISLELIQPGCLCCEMGCDREIHIGVFITHGKRDSSDIRLGFFCFCPRQLCMILLYVHVAAEFSSV